MPLQPKPWVFFLVVALSLGLGMILNVFPLSRTASMLRPEFLCLIVLYWVVNVPERLGVFFAWGTGLFQDIVEGAVWGSHALALTVLAHICLFSWRRIRSYSIWHQSMWVFVLVGTHQVVVSWIQGLAGYYTGIHIILLPTITSALLWPAIFPGLHRLRMHLRIH